MARARCDRGAQGASLALAHDTAEGASHDDPQERLEEIRVVASAGRQVLLQPLTRRVQDDCESRRRDRKLNAEGVGVCRDERCDRVLTLTLELPQTLQQFR